MKKSYHIKFINKYDKTLFKVANKAEINCSPWEKYKSPYDTNVYLLYDKKNIYVHMTTTETKIKAVNNMRDSNVCKDSCMEFFLQPNINNPDYVNFEINPLGTLYLGYNSDTDDKTTFSEDTEIFCIESDINEYGWSLTYLIPLEFLKKYFKNITSVMRGNFYKCGDETDLVHYAVWNEIDSAEISFHNIGFFGDIIFD